MKAIVYRPRSDGSGIRDSEPAGTYETVEEAVSRVHVGANQKLLVETETARHWFKSETFKSPARWTFERKVLR